MMPSRLIVLVSGAALLASCTKSDPASGGGAGPAHSHESADLSKPILTEARIKGFATSLDEHPEFFKDFAKNPGAMALAPGWSQAKLAELDTFAKKYGFKDFNDYGQVLSRVFIGKGQLAMEEARKSMQEQLSKQGAGQDQEGVPPEMKKMLEEQAKAQKAMIENMGKDGPQMNAADLELIRKHWEAIEKGMEKVDAAGNKD